MPASATVFSGGFSHGDLTFGVEGGSSSIAKDAASQWNDVSSNASYTYSSQTGPYGLTADVITYCDLYEPSTAGLLGQLVPFKSFTGASASPASTSDTWVKAAMYQYKNSALDTYTKKLGTATHEFGHGLSVAHPPSGTTAVMMQGVKNFYSLQSYDKKSLKAKWGN